MRAYRSALPRRVGTARVCTIGRDFRGQRGRQGFPAYVDIHRLFKRGEAIAPCKQALAAGPMKTCQLAFHVMKAKSLDQGDKVLAKSIGRRLIHALRMQSQRGRMRRSGKHKAALIWELPPEKTLI